MGEKQALRPYQEAARKSIHTEWENGRLRTLLVLPTGTGKTIVFASVAADQVRAGDRVLILAHRGELLEQAADKLQRSTGLVSAVEKAESTCLDSWYRVVVGSVQTLQRPARLERFPPGLLRDYHHRRGPPFHHRRLPPHPRLLRQCEGPGRDRYPRPGRYAKPRRGVRQLGL